MNAMREDIQHMAEALAQLRAATEKLRSTFLGGIHGPDEYSQAVALLDHLTDGHPLTSTEDSILGELTQVIIAYENHAGPLTDFNAEWQQPQSPIDNLKTLMAAHHLTGADLPEIGSKTVVSKVLNGHRPLSYRMAYALAERFAVSTDTFVQRARTS